VVDHGDRALSGILSYDDFYTLAGMERAAWEAEGPGRRMEDLVSRIRRLRSLSAETLKAEAAKVRSYLQATFGRDLETSKAFLHRVQAGNVSENLDMYMRATEVVAKIEGLERAIKDTEKIIKERGL
jgi:hypothetical protein